MTATETACLPFRQLYVHRYMSRMIHCVILIRLGFDCWMISYSRHTYMAHTDPLVLPVQQFIFVERECNRNSLSFISAALRTYTYESHHTYCVMHCVILYKVGF